MPLNLVEKQIFTTKPLNDVNDLVSGDQTAGGTGAALYDMRGVRILLDNAAALALTNVTTLKAVYAAFGTPQTAPTQCQYFAGIYQYVRFLAASTATTATGQVVFMATTQTGANLFLSDGSQYQVTPDGSASVGDGLWAGIAVTTITKGYYGWIQIAGLALALTIVSPADNNIGDLAVITTTTFTVDSIADATAIATAGAAKRIIGIFAEAPGAVASLSLHRVLLKPNCWIF